MRNILLAAGLMALVACNPGEDAQSEERFAPDLEVAVDSLMATSSGLKYQDLAVGDGDEAISGKEVVVHYTGWLTDGSKFDSSVDQGRPFPFTLGAGSVISGWDEGVAGMKVGGKRKLVIPPALGYGSSGFPPVIPPNATLVFDVELLEVR
jgi:FKBP-type peptidyl-prolyl cis-trans isomerase FkpA